MSANATAAPVAMSAKDTERGHRRRLLGGYVLFITLIAALGVHGFGYYTLESTERPFSPLHAALKPSGWLGLRLGFGGFAMFAVIFLYPLRKRWPWLQKQGSTRHWLDFHVLLGLSAPFVIAFHSSFKFAGFAGMAFWIMAAVSASGVAGRYLYGQIPRSLSAAELSRKESQELQQQMAEQLAEQKLLPESDLRRLLRLPSPEKVERWSIVFALLYMLALDVVRPLHIARLRRHALESGHRPARLWGIFRTSHQELERAIDTAREEAALSKRILFLSRSQPVFHLWHVVHKPFSYSFAVLVVIHVVVVMMMGYF